MRGQSRPVAMLAGLLVAIAVTGSASAATPALDLLDPATAAQASAWLADRGMDESDVVVQTGLRNYAGPNCPGDAWTCAPAGVPVIQASYAAADNVFDCTTSPCEVFQSSDGGSNTARCLLVGRGANVTQSCDVTQENTTGPNVIEAREEATDSQGFLGSSFTQTTVQTVTCDQSNGSGTNSVTAVQRSDLSSSANVSHPVVHTQEATTSFDCEQTSASGNQTAAIDQDQIQSSDLIATQVVQKQNNANDGVDLDVSLTQTSGSGVGTTTLTQDEDFDQQASALLGGVTQLQGPGSATGFNAAPESGIAAILVVDSATGSATYDVDQVKSWDMRTGTVTGTITQVQDDRLSCCLGLEDFGQTPDLATVDHTSDLFASKATAPQRATHRAKIAAKTNAVYTSTITFDDTDTTTETASGRFIQSGRTCQDDSPCEQHPESTNVLRGSVRETSPENEAEFRKETEGPNNGTYEVRIEFQNFSDEPAPDIRIYWQMPAGFTMVSAAGCQKNGPTIKCQRGTGLPGETKTVYGTIQGRGTVAPGTLVTIAMRVVTGSASEATSEARIRIV